MIFDASSTVRENKRKAFRVVGIIARRRAVQSFAIEIWRILHKVKVDAAQGSPRDDRGEAVLVVKGNGDAAHDVGGSSSLVWR